MRLAVLSDIHGNLEALRAVLADMHAQAPDSVLCLGDAVGYGPDPEAVTRLLHERGIPCLQGNHEQAALDPRKRGWFNSLAKRSLGITLTLLSPAALEILSSWPTVIARDDCLAVHGCPPDDAFTYLFQYEESFSVLFDRFYQPLCFVGHTHMLQLVAWDGKRSVLQKMTPGRIFLKPDHRHIVNAGSVGQPRDGNNAAKYVIWDSDGHFLDIRAVPYDFETTMAKIRALGFPEVNARLLKG